MSDDMRREYRALSDEEKDQITMVKDLGLRLHNLVGELGSSHELRLARDRIEEAVMWAVKHITR